MGQGDGIVNVRNMVNSYAIILYSDISQNCDYCETYTNCSVTKLHLALCNPMDCAHQAAPSFTTTRNLLKLMSTELVMSSNHLLLCRPLLFLPSIFPAPGSFPVSQLFTSGGQSIGAPASILSMNIQG